MRRCRAIGLLSLALASVVCAGPAGLVIDYPESGSVFPPDFAPLTFLWHDRSSAAVWRVEISFASGAVPLRFSSRGPMPQAAEIDPDCISSTNELPRVDRTQKSWRPAEAEWTQIRHHAGLQGATVKISGTRAGKVVSESRIELRFSPDPVGAPIFYRDVPLMPVETAPGTIQPLSPYAVRLVKWRLRSTNETASRVVMEGLPVCANCHSFSADGRVMGMDLDGLRRTRAGIFWRMSGRGWRSGTRT
ncbi:MAG: hypothetical protein QM757_42100 [Paludibaculum sp.]